MRLALVNNERTLPTRGAKGQCPVCGSEVIARCGDVRIHHWAHRGQRVCDHWWEPKTDWHYEWQGKFPLGWQERIQNSPSGERHVADVLTEHGLTLEFQYSHLDQAEIAAREAFYGTMFWVVSGARLQRDFPRFVEGMWDRVCSQDRRAFLLNLPDKVFHKNWTRCSKPVFFDFDGAKTGFNPELAALTAPLWCLLPAIGTRAVVLKISREDFVGAALGGTTIMTPEVKRDYDALIAAVAKQMAEERFYASRYTIRLQRRPRRWRARF